MTLKKGFENLHSNILKLQQCPYHKFLTSMLDLHSNILKLQHV